MRRVLMVMVFVVAASLYLAPFSAATTYDVSFGDGSKYWTGWNNNTTGDDSSDTIGTPNFTGGNVNVSSGGFLTEISVEQSSSSSYYSLLAAGDLFIDADADEYWDYVVTLSDAWGSDTAGPSNDNPGAGNYYLYNVSLGLTDGSHYTLSGADDTGAWDGYLIRDRHPVAWVGPLGEDVPDGEAYFSGWNDSYTESWTFDFADGLILLDDSFTIGWTVNCANDVIYETMTNPIPEPATMLLLGTGLIGLAGIGRKKFKQ